MIFYEIMINSKQALTSLERYEAIMRKPALNTTVEMELALFMNNQLDEYKAVNRGHVIRVIINDVKETGFKILVSYEKYLENEDGFDAYIKKAFYKCFGLEVEILSRAELTTSSFYYQALKSEGRDDERRKRIYTNDGMLDFDYLSERDDSYTEDIYPVISKEEILKKARKLMPDPSLMDELDRIFAIDKGRYYGVPVHYVITAGTSEAAKDIVEVLVEALLYSHRIFSGRTSYIKSAEFVDSMTNTDVKIMIGNNQGAVTVVEFNEKKEDDDCLSPFDDDLTDAIVRAFKSYKKHSQLIFVELIGQQQGIKQFHKAISQEVTLVNIKEGSGNLKEAEAILEGIVAKSELGRFLNFEDVKKAVFAKEEINYSLSTLYKKWDAYEAQALIDGIYTQYKPLMTAKIVKTEKELDETSPLSRFNHMIGLGDVKKTAMKIIATFKVQKVRESLGLDKMSFSRHMLFTGNPGTAKTTVARLMAQIFAKEGITTTSTFVECGRSDLVGQYVGQTAVKVKKVFEEAKGGVLFIDEAYSLLDGYRGYYGDEAIATIVQEMENNRKDTIVIFAGYPEQMAKFLDVNEGLRSRIGFQLAFPDYSASELLEILELMLKEREYTLSADAKAKSLLVFEEALKNTDFGNGRFVRNLLEQMIMQQSLRIFSESNTKEWDKDSISILTADDIPQGMVPKAKVQSKGIGFHCA